MSFDPVAATYDLQSDPDRRLSREGPFLKSLAPKGARVLDLACATGAHAAYLARWGAEVIACDLSPHMIDIARTKRAHPRVTYEVSDMREPPAGVFDLILCIGNSLNMLPGRDDVVTTLEAARASLAGEGALLLHLINPEAPAHREPTVNTKSGVLDGVEARVVKAMVPRESERLVTIGRYLRAPGETEWTTAATAGVLLDLTHDELDALLADAGFATRTWYGGLDGSDYIPGGSPDLVVKAG